MANDPGLSNDTCIFMEAIPGDRGNHDPNNVWWLSPDISLVGPVSGPDNADAGQVNPVNVTVRRKSASSNCIFPGDESLITELWVANPSLVMSPRVRNSAKQIALTGTTLPPEGSTAIQHFDFTPPAVPHPGDPQSPGHKCLAARVYPSSLVPSAANFFTPGDQHVAQHNLCIVKTTSQNFTFAVNTVNPDGPLTPIPPPLPPVVKHPVKLRAILDLHPSNFVNRVVGRALEAAGGAHQFRTSPLPNGFRFDLAHLQASKIVDHSHGGVIHFPPHTNPSFEAQIELTERQVTPLTFLADLHGTQPGDACIFHLIQTSISNAAEGGLTVVALRQ